MTTGETTVGVAVPIEAGESTHFATHGLTELFHDAVAAHPDRVAVVDDDRSLTYRQLAAQVMTAAQHLRAAGVAPDDRVGLFVEPSTELVVTVWSVVCAGGGYVPLSPDYPDERLRYMMQDARPRGGAHPGEPARPAGRDRAAGHRGRLHRANRAGDGTSPRAAVARPAA